MKMESISILGTAYGKWMYPRTGRQGRQSAVCEGKSGPTVGKDYTLQGLVCPGEELGFHLKCSGQSLKESKVT